MLKQDATSIKAWSLDLMLIGSIMPYRQILIVFLFIAAGLAFPRSASGDSQTYAVRGEFTNNLTIPPGQNPAVTCATSAVFFGGHIGKLPDPANGNTLTTPTGGGINLVQSSFGQAFAGTVPYPDFQQDSINTASKLLYYEKGDTSSGSPLSRDKSAFRYKVYLYRMNGNEITSQVQSIKNYWTPNERARAWAAGQILRDALKYDPMNNNLRNALLDIYYDIAVAETTLANEQLLEAQKAALGLGRYAVPPPGEFLISHEITQTSAALPIFDSAMRPYFDLLKDPMGVDTWNLEANSPYKGVPFGYYLFAQEVPKRSLFAPVYMNATNGLQPLVDDNKDGQGDVLFVGFKDLVLLFNLERDAANAAAKLAKLYALRGVNGDTTRAQSVVGYAQQKSYTDGSILNGIFTPAQLAQVDNKSGLTEARASWGQGLSSLSGVKSFLDGKANPLGLDKDFLALVQTDLEAQTANTNDSYDYFASILLPPGSLNGTGLLGDAYSKYDQAYQQFEKVQMNRDTIAAELDAQRTKYDDRLRSIVGASFGSPAYATPDKNAGGEIYIQLQNIEQARLRIEHNDMEINNLHAQIENEIDRRGKEAGISKLIQQVYINYGQEQANLTEKIGGIMAGQAAANCMAQAAASLGNWTKIDFGGIGSAAYAANAAIQEEAERKKASLQGDKEKLAAEERSQIQFKNDQISAANSEARVKDLWLNMNTLAIESEEASIALAQEMSKLTALLDEKLYLETRRAEARNDLSTRYFADPSHRLILDQRIINAGFAFDQAQLWVFMLARALEYKWNTQVIATGTDGRNYTASTVFALRNAKELLEMARAMRNWNDLRPVGIRGGDQFVKFSLREDFLGFRRLDIDGNELQYPDPKTGQMVDALTAFRSYLKYIAPHGKPSNSGLSLYKDVVHLEFNTAKTNFEGTFFSPGRWNEKIKWLSVQIDCQSALTQLSVYLAQSGVGYIRNSTAGTQDPAQPDVIRGEMTEYPTRYWYQESDPVTGMMRWMSKDTFGFTLNARVASDPDIPPGTWQKKEFHEMPPAVSKWILEIPVVNSGGTTILNLDKVSDIQIWFENYYKTRN